MLVDHFIASYPEPPAAIVLDLDHSDDPTHGQQEFAFYNNYYQNHCCLPLFIFEGTSHALVTACLRPGKRPTGAENAMILVRLLAYLRRHWPQTHILVRGDSHFATPEVIEVGMDTYHCHHASLQPMYPRPWALAFGGMMEEERPQQCEACIDCTKSLTLCAWFTYHTSIQLRTQIEVQLDY